MNPSAIELARKALPDADLRAGTFEQTEFPMHSFDIITAWDVMEHVHDVQGFLGKVDQLLKPGGFFVFETGNFSSTFARFAGLSWYYYSPIEHTVFYDPRVIHHVLPRSGFQVLKIVRTAHADPHEKYGALRTRVLSVLVAAYSLRGRLRLMHVLVARLLRKNGTVPQPDFLDHVVVTARKLES